MPLAPNSCSPTDPREPETRTESPRRKKRRKRKHESQQEEEENKHPEGPKRLRPGVSAVPVWTMNGQVPGDRLGEHSGHISQFSITVTRQLTVQRSQSMVDRLYALGLGWKAAQFVAAKKQREGRGQGQDMVPACAPQ